MPQWNVPYPERVAGSSGGIIMGPRNTVEIKGRNVLAEMSFAGVLEPTD